MSGMKRCRVCTAGPGCPDDRCSDAKGESESIAMAVFRWFLCGRTSAQHVVQYSNVHTVVTNVSDVSGFVEASHDHAGPGRPFR